MSNQTMLLLELDIHEIKHHGAFLVHVLNDLQKAYRECSARKYAQTEMGKQKNEETKN